jgi:hypothetical protein
MARTKSILNRSRSCNRCDDREKEIDEIGAVAGAFHHPRLGNSVMIQLDRTVWKRSRRKQPNRIRLRWYGTATLVAHALGTMESWTFVRDNFDAARVLKDDTFRNKGTDINKNRSAVVPRRIQHFAPFDGWHIVLVPHPFHNNTRICVTLMPGHGMSSGTEERSQCSNVQSDPTRIQRIHRIVPKLVCNGTISE